MKKILIVNNNLHMGGVQKALVNLLWSIRGQYDITLLLFYDGGVLRNEIPPEVQVISLNSAYRWLGMNKYDVKGKPFDLIMRSFFAAITKLFGRKTAVTLMNLTQKNISGYDASISYLHNSSPKSFYGGCNEFVLNHVSAERKIAFLHCDYDLCGANEGNAESYTRFDRIAACSQGCADAFLRHNPQLKEKLFVVRNCHRFEQIRSLAEHDATAPQADKLHVVTVARLSPEKGIDRALQAICGLNLHYTIIGDGKDRAKLVQMIAEYGMSEQVTLLGELSNPYLAMKQADLLLIPSLHEAAPLVIDEAACLGTPILTTRTCSAEEMVQHRGFGWVCDNSVEALRLALQMILQNPNLLAERREWLHHQLFSNNEAVRQFHDLIER